MVCINSKNQKGGGIMDTLMKPFTYEKYKGERHGYSLNSKTFLTPFAYLGPHTAVLEREKRGDTQVVDDLDQYAKDHDYSYLKEKTEYEKDHDKQKHMANIWKADDEFVRKSYNSKDEPIMGPIASKLIQTKENLEKHHLMDTKRFSGMGTEKEEESTDPVQRLRDIVKQQYKSEEKQKNKKKVQKGGFLPLVPIGIAIASAIGSKLAGDLYDYVKKKVTGNGYNMNHKTLKDKKLFLKDFINNIE